VFGAHTFLRVAAVLEIDTVVIKAKMGQQVYLKGTLWKCGCEKGPSVSLIS